MNRTASYVVMILAELLGAGSLVLFAAFLFLGPVVAVRLGLTDRAALYWDAVLSLAFFVQHSVMVRAWFKDWSARWTPREFHGANYSIASGVVLAAVMVFWQPTTATIIELGGAPRWALRSVAVLAICGFVWGVRALRTFDTFGRRPISARLRGETLPPSEFVMRGPYLWVRHPLTFFMMVLVWANPDVTTDRGLFNVLWTVWMVIGSFFEERDLVAEFGERYRAYQRVVPMLLPWRGPIGKTLLEPPERTRATLKFG